MRAGDVVMVTGASSGIGLAASRALARAGATVVLAARSGAKLEQEAEGIRREGGRALAVALDVTSDASVRDGVAEVLARLGRIDVLINNAGNGGRLARWADTDPAATRVMFEVHVFGMERVSRAVLPAMLARGRGTIVNIASVVAEVPMPNAAAYCAAKAAVVAFSGSLRGELGPRGIDVRVFAPPHTRTAAGDAWPLGLARTFSPEWVADALVRSLRRGDARVFAGSTSWMLLALHRVAPGLASRVMTDIGLRAGDRCSRASGRPACPPDASRSPAGPGTRALAAAVRSPPRPAISRP